MYNLYSPSPKIECYRCGLKLDDDWQGKEGDISLDRYIEGQEISDHPDVFSICNTCRCGAFIEADCFIVNGRWLRTIVERTVIPCPK